MAFNTSENICDSFSNKMAIEVRTERKTEILNIASCSNRKELYNYVMDNFVIDYLRDDYQLYQCTEGMWMVPVNKDDMTEFGNHSHAFMFP